MSLPEEPRGPIEGQAVDERRAATVRRASDVWQRQLVDLSGRNRLLYYRDQQLGTIDLGAANAPADPVAVDQLLAGARAAWLEAGGEPDALRVARVPGAFELPLA